MAVMCRKLLRLIRPCMTQRCSFTLLSAAGVPQIPYTFVRGNSGNLQELSVIPSVEAGLKIFWLLYDEKSIIDSQGVTERRQSRSKYGTKKNRN